MKVKGKILFGTIGILICIGLLVFLLRRDLTVLVDEVTPRDFSQVFWEKGLVKAKDEHTVFPPYSSRIDKVLVREGDEVKAGQLLVDLDTKELVFAREELEARLAGVQIELRQAEEEQKIAEKNYQRHLTLHREELLADIQLEEAERLLNQSRHRLAAIIAQENALTAREKLLQQQKDEHRIYAPISGVISKVKAQKQGRANPQTPLLSIINTTGLEVETGVLTSDINDVSPGMPVSLVFKMREEELQFPGKVISIAPYAEGAYSPLGLEEERVKVLIGAEIPATVTIAPGYKLDVGFTTRVIPRALVVPKQALFTYQGEDALFVVKDRRAKIQAVSLGRENRWEAVVSEGLAAGDLVVLDPQTPGLREGIRLDFQIRGVKNHAQ